MIMTLLLEFGTMMIAPMVSGIRGVGMQFPNGTGRPLVLTTLALPGSGDNTYSAILTSWLTRRYRTHCKLWFHILLCLETATPDNGSTEQSEIHLIWISLVISSLLLAVICSVTVIIRKQAGEGKIKQNNLALS